MESSFPLAEKRVEHSDDGSIDYFVKFDNDTSCTTTAGILQCSRYYTCFETILFSQTVAYYSLVHIAIQSWDYSLTSSFVLD